MANEGMRKESKGSMSVAEAGRKGGAKTSERHGHEFYEEIGHKGGQKVKELVEKGKQAEKRQVKLLGSPPRLKAKEGDINQTKASTVYLTIFTFTLHISLAF